MNKNLHPFLQSPLWLINPSLCARLIQFFVPIPPFVPITDRYSAGEWESLPNPVSQIPKPSEGYMATLIR